MPNSHREYNKSHEEYCGPSLLLKMATNFLWQRQTCVNVYWSIYLLWVSRSRRAGESGHPIEYLAVLRISNDKSGRGSISPSPAHFLRQLGSPAQYAGIQPIGMLEKLVAHQAGCTSSWHLLAGTKCPLRPYYCELAGPIRTQMLPSYSLNILSHLSTYPLDQILILLCR
jgi:hypothetical protein